MGVRHLTLLGILVGTAAMFVVIGLPIARAEPPQRESQPPAWGSSPTGDQPPRRVIASSNSPPKEHRAGAPDDALPHNRTRPPSPIQRISHREPMTESGLRLATPRRIDANTRTARVSNPLAFRVEVHGPQQSTPGQLLRYRLVVGNTTRNTLQGVELVLPIPEKARYVSSKPTGMVEHGSLRWPLPPLVGNAEGSIELILLTQELVRLDLRPEVRLQAAQPFSTSVIEAPFSLKQTAPEQVRIGMPVRFELTLHNKNAFPLNRVLLRTRLPDGLKHPQGKVIGAELGSLKPGETRKMELTATAEKAGRLVNEVTALAEGGQVAHSNCVVLVTKPRLTLEVAAPEEARFGETLTCRLRVVHCSGDSPADDVQLEVRIPRGLTFHSASHNGTHDRSTDRVVWPFGDLRPGQVEEVTLTFRPQQVGTWKFGVSVRSRGIVEAAGEHTVILDHPNNYRLTIQADHNPLEVGKETLYEVRLSNGGPATGKHSRLTAWLPEGVAPVRTLGPVPARILQQKIQFDPVDILEGESQVAFRFRVRGQRVGNWRMRVDLHSEGWPSIHQEMRVLVRPARSPEGPRPGELGSLEK